MYSLPVLLQLTGAVLVWVALVMVLPLCIQDKDRPDYWKLMSVFHAGVLFAVILETV
jgi:zinc transporter ZupT